MTLRDKMLEIGVTPKAASRRTNAIAKEHKVVAKAVSWGIDTFGEFAPTKMSDIRKAENSDIFKAIARVAFQRGFDVLPGLKSQDSSLTNVKRA